MAVVLTPSSKTEVYLNVTELGAGAGRINVRDQAFSQSVSIIGRQAEAVAERQIETHIPNICQAAVAVAGAPCVSKRLWLKCAATSVPKVLRICQAQGVKFRPDNQLMGQAEYR